MLCSSKSLLLPLTYFRVASPAKVRVSASLPEGDPSSSDPNSGADPPEGAKAKQGSGKLNRWARARALRSGRKLRRRADGDNEESGSSAPLPIPSGSSLHLAAAAADEAEDDQLAEDGGEAKAIFLVSDGTGWTAEYAVNAALGQFEQCLAERICPVNTHLFSGIDDMERLMEIIKQAAKEGALLLYTLADPSMAEEAKNACRLWGVPFSDVLGPIIEAIATHLGVAPSGAPGRKMPLSKEYFRRIEAIDFTIKQDDGALPQNLAQADIVLVGVSRAGKTPLSIYIAQKGYKVANVPLVLGIQPPKPLFEIDQEKIFALTINPGTLQGIRRSRAKSLGFTREMGRNYSDMDHVRKELEFVGELYAQNPSWPVIEVTGKAVEETAAVILRILHDRKDKHTMPRITKRY